MNANTTNPAHFYAAPAEHPHTVAMQTRYGHPRTILLAQCCYNADILHYIEDYAHFAEVSARRTAQLPTQLDAELFSNMQFYAARRALYGYPLFSDRKSPEHDAIECRSMAYCRELFNPDTGQPQ